MTTLVLTILVRSLVLGALGLMAERLLAHRPAALRHAVVVATLGAMLFATVASFIPAQEQMAGIKTALPTSASQVPSPIADPQSNLPLSDAPIQLPLWFTLSRTAGRVWLDGAAILALGLLLRLLLVGRWVRRSQPITQDGAPVPVLLSERVKVPMTGWWGRHFVMVPPEWTTWDPERRRIVLAHEQAHIRRQDWLSHLGVTGCCIAIWPNPFAWILLRRSRDLAEQAADDLVLAEGFTPSDYAGQLLGIARDLRRGFVPLALPMAAQPIARRIEMILKQNPQRAAVTGSLLVLVAASGMAAAVLTGGWSFVSAKQPSSPKEYPAVVVPGPGQGDGAERPIPQPHLNAKGEACRSNLKQAALATLMFVADNNDRFATSNRHWASDVDRYLKTKAVFRCPLDKDGTVSYTFNDTIKGLTVAKIGGAARDTIMLYEGKDRMLDFRHEGRAGVAFADGHVQMITKKELPRFIWNPMLAVPASQP